MQGETRYSNRYLARAFIEATNFSIRHSDKAKGSVAIPFIISGSIVIALLFAYAVLDEPIAVTQWLGRVLVLAGIALLFWKERI